MQIEDSILRMINEVMNDINQRKSNGSNNETQEIEMRFGKFSGNGKFNPQINLKTFEECIRFLNTFAKLEKIEYSNIEYYNNCKKYTIMETPKDCIFSFKPTENIFYIEKQNLRNIDICDYNVRFSYNNEKLMEKKELHDKPHLYAIRKRFTYKYLGLTFDVSMMVRDNKIITNEYQNDIQYDLEIEINEGYKENNLKLLLDITYEFLKIINECSIVLSENAKEQITNVYYDLTRSKKFVGSQPQTISSDKINTEYAMTLKLNGKRALLMNYGSGFVDISTKMDIKASCIGSPNKLKDISILDTEYFKGVYHVFDILFYEGNDIRNQLFKTRMELISKLIEKINNKNIIQKEYIFGDIYENTIKYYKKYFSKKNENLDGFIYVPVNMDYNSITLKWKPNYYNTIDFKIKKLGNLTWELLCYESNGSNDNECKFYTNEYNNLGATVVTQEQENTYTNGSVIEFVFSKIDEKFIPIKTRYDKVKGNYITVAQDNFKNIMYPFTFDEFKQPKIKELTLFNSRRFNNFIKRKLLMENSKNVYTLLDLACGKGGDMFKWVDANITYVKGYDNDNQSIKEANNRYNTNIRDENTTKNYHFTFEYTDLSCEVINPQLQDFVNYYSHGNYVSDGKFDVATCFFAIHYFFKNENYLDNFINNITYNLKKNGTFIMTTFDEELLLQEGDIDTTLFKVNGINKVNGVNKNKMYGRAINVWIKDTVLDKEREEYLVNFDFLVEKLKLKGIELIKTGTFTDFYQEWKTKKNHLNDIEKKLSFLNRYAIFKFNGTFRNGSKDLSNVPQKNVFKFEEFNDELNDIEMETEIKSNSFTKAELQKKKMPELKQILTSMNLSQLGKKEVLINRILEN
jgi:mRNA (guanine-N7-)-methyltransferase